ncbi:MAG TPA: hypothetical protein VFZ66_00685 [Herpetosiphonaceae bacterium]
MSKRLAIGGGAALLLIMSAWLGFGAWSGRAAELDPLLRTVVIVAPGEQRPTLSGEDIAVDLEAGALPSGVRRATVLSDKDCAADEQGVSHCLNDLKIGRTQVAVRHHHKMIDEPCFSPTEQLNVVDVATYATLRATQEHL